MKGQLLLPRNLIESLCKYFLDYFNEEYNNKDDLPGFIGKFQITLTCIRVNMQKIH